MKDLVKKFCNKIMERESVQYDYKKSNKLHYEIHAIFKTLRDKGELDSLEPLLTHDNINVASYAAQYFLIEDEDKALNALNALRNLTKRDGVDPFVINHTIQQWENGELNFDY